MDNEYCKPNRDGSLTWEIMNIPDNQNIQLLVKTFKKKVLRDSSFHYTVNPTIQEFDQLLKGEYSEKTFILYLVNLKKIQ